MSATPAATGAKALRERVWAPAANPFEPPILRRPAVYVVAAATVTVLGLNWPIMADAVDLVPPFWLSAFRMAGAAIVVGALTAARGRIRRPPREDLPVLLSIGLVNLAFVTTAVYAALRFVPPGRSAVLTHTASLWAAPIAAIALRERLTSRRVIGIAVGIGGLALLLEPGSLDWTNGRILGGIALLLASAIALGATIVHMRAHRWRTTPLDLMPWELAVAAIPVSILAAVVDGVPHVDWTARTVLIVAYQIFATGFGVWGATTVARSLPAISASLSLMAVPVIGLGSSIAVADEPATLGAALGLTLVLGGVAIGLLADRSAPPPAAPSP